MSEVVDIFNLSCECSICLENIVGVSNKVVTECGHTFHCKCLMKNVSFNGFGCPYCRNVMAEEVEDSDDEDDEDDDDDDEDDDEDDEDRDDDDEENKKMPDSTYVTLKLKERGIRMEDLVKIHLFIEHSNWGRYYREYQEKYGDIYREIETIFEEYESEPESAEPGQITPDEANQINNQIVNNDNINNDNNVVYDIVENITVDEIVYDTLDTIIDVIEYDNENK